MLSPVGERGQRRKSLFDFDESRPFDLRQGNPLEALFKIYLANDLRSIVGNRIARLRTIHRPKGTVSIGGRKDEPGTANPDEIPGRESDGEAELIADIMGLLARKARQPAVGRFTPFNNGRYGDTGATPGIRPFKGRFGPEDHREDGGGLCLPNRELAVIAAS